MNEARTVCPNCGRHDELTPEHFQRLVGANREAAMQALGVRRAEEAPKPRFSLTPSLEPGPDGKEQVVMRRST